MDLVGAWLRQLLRAGTAAAIVPVAIVAALVVVLVGAGGLGGLSALRQIVVGPEISPAQADGAGAGTPEVAPIAPPAGRPAPRRAAPPVAATPEVAPPPPLPAAPPAPRPAPPAPPPPPPAPPQVATAPPPPPPPPPPPAPAAPKERPALEQTTQRLVDGIDQTLDTVGELLVTIIDRLGRLLPPPRH